MGNQANGWQQWISVLDAELDVETRKASSPSEMHAKDHISRVLGRCIRLGEKVGGDLEVLVAAAYLHDLGRHFLEAKGHGMLSAEKAKPVLERIDFPAGKRETVLHAIRVHDTTAAPEERTTLESRILFDADKLDTFGVVGVLRYIRQVYGKWPIDFVLYDIETRWKGLSLPETRDLARKDYEYIRDYFIRLKDELAGGPEKAALTTDRGVP